MQRKFAVFDIDGTLIRWQLYHATVDRLVKLGAIDADKFRAVQELRMTWKKRATDDAFKPYEMGLVELYESALPQLTRSQILEAMHDVVETYKDQVYTFTRNLVKQLKQQDYLLFAISGSQEDIVGMLAEHYGFDDWGGTQYEYDGERVTDTKLVLRRDQKPVYLRELVAKHDATYAGSIGVGDSDSDIPTLEIVELPIAFNPNRLLLEHAQARGWQIVVERKNVVYTLQPSKDSDGRYLLA